MKTTYRRQRRYQERAALSCRIEPAGSRPQRGRARRAGRAAPAALVVLWAACGAARAGDFKVSAATYLGGASPKEQWTAVDVAPDGTIVVAGAAPKLAGGAAETKLLGGGDGVVLRLSADGTKLLSVTRIGDYVEDMEADAKGRIAVTGSFGVAVLSADASSVVWRDEKIIVGKKAAQFSNQTPPFREDRYTRRVARLAVGADGHVASIQNAVKKHGREPKQGHLYVWDAGGKRLCDVHLIQYKYPKDVCVDAANRQVIVGGFNTYKADSRHMAGHPIHMPWMAAYTYGGKRNWEAYNFPAKAVYAENTFADSRVQRLAIGADGYLYMGGYIHGGDYVWRHDPFDVKKRPKIETGRDGFSRAYGMGRGMDFSYFAKYEAKTGRVLQGQALLARSTERGGRPAQIQIKGIDADKGGNLYLSGYTQAFIKGRSTCRVAGQAVGEYYKPEAFLMVVAPDFKKRRLWTVFSRRCESASWGVAVGETTAALIAEVYEGRMITAGKALLTKPPGPIDGYLVTWKPPVGSAASE